MQLRDPTSESHAIFRANFLKDFREVLSASSATVVTTTTPTAATATATTTAENGHNQITQRQLRVTNLDHCDFSLIRKHLELQRLIKKAATDEEKAATKQLKQQQQLQHGYALVDGHVECVGNYMIEPPSLFRGRGLHPLMGKIKSRVMSEEVSLNVSECTAPPKCSDSGRHWGSIRHDNTVTWLASWHETIRTSNKYVMLSASSSLKGQSDREKYQVAMRLKG